VVMSGRCEVTAIQPLAVAPGAAAPSSLRALMRLRLREMDAHSRGIHLRLMERHASSSGGQGVPVETPVTDLSAATVVQTTRPPMDTEPTAIAPPPRVEMRMPGATFTLPANPLSDLAAADLGIFVDHTLLEANGAAAAALRITRRVVLSAACLVLGLLLGSALRPASTAAPPAVRSEVVAPPPAAAPNARRPASPSSPSTPDSPSPPAEARGRAPSSDRRQPNPAQRGRRAGTQRARRSIARACSTRCT
jgi:hypothetical protein